MAVTFILGRAGSGKTHHCLDAILGELSRPAESRRLILLVPEQASFQMERALATRAPEKGYWRAEVLSFSRLAQRLLSSGGSEPAVLSAEARGLALRRVVRQAAGEAGLKTLRAAAEKSGFFLQLGRLIEELLRENVSPAELRDAGPRLKDHATRRRLDELTGIYEGYLAWLGPRRVDSAARLSVLRQQLSGAGWLVGAGVWVDGFAGFTGQELATLVELARVAREMTITLLLDPSTPAVQDHRRPPAALGLFQRTEATYQRLLALFHDAGVEVCPPIEPRPAVLPRFTKAPSLARLEAGWATPIGVGEDLPAGGEAPASEITLRRCATHRDELRAAARWIRTLIADSDGELSFRDFAVIARDLGPFVQLIAEVFAEYEIPHFLDRRRPLRTHPLSRLMTSLFEAVATDCDARPMVRLLRTRLLPLTRDEAERLENVVLRESLRGMETWRKPGWELERAGNIVTTCAAQRTVIVAALEPLAVLAAEGRAVGGTEWAGAIHECLETLGVRRQIEAWMSAARDERRWESFELHRQAWETLRSLLDDLHDVLGDTPATAGDVAAILGSALGDMTLGLAPPALDQVLVSAIERSRHPDIKHAWLMAFNEGVFPARPAEDLLLTAEQRRELADAGLPAPASHREDALGERLLAYIAMTRPSRGLTISFATVADDGGELLPSPLLREVTRALPELTVQPVATHEPPVSVAELAREYLGLRGDAPAGGASRRYQRLCQRARAAAALAGPLAWMLRGEAYTNEPPPIGNFRKPEGGRANVVWDASPSEIETYLQCPFKHFAKRGLRLSADRGPRPLRLDLGNVAHEILAELTERAMNEPGGARGLSDERWTELFEAAEEAYWRRQPRDLSDRRPDLAIMGQVLSGFLRDVVMTHAERWRRGEFEPRFCEVGFGPDKGKHTLAALRLRMSGGRETLVHGKIDRLDICRHEGHTLLAVYDYKSSGVGPINQDFLTGNRLQLFLYLLAVSQTWAGAQPGQPAGVMLAPLYPSLRALDTQHVANAPPVEQTMHMYRPRGLITQAAGRLLDRELSERPSPVAQIRLKKDGDFYATSDARPVDEIERRLDLARDTVLFAAEGIARGCVDVAPLVENRTRACRTCEFHAVCRFDPAYNQPRAAEAVLPRLDRGAAS